MTKFQQMFYDIKHTKDYKVIGDDIDYKVFVDDKNKQVILQFEESDSREDWKHNLMFLPWLLKLNKKYVITTHGFAVAYKSAKDLPIHEFITLCEKNPTYKTVIRGWSFGSAMTKIAVRHYYYIMNKPIDEQYTFGDVKIWFNPFISILANKWSKIRYEFGCINDFVTWCVPICLRTKRCRVGGKFSIKRIFNTPYEHTHYEEYDYSKYEN